MQSHDVVEVHTSVFSPPNINQSKTCIHPGHHIITQVYQKEETSQTEDSSQSANVSPELEGQIRFSETKMAGGHKSRKGLEWLMI